MQTVRTEEQFGTATGPSFQEDMMEVSEEMDMVEMSRTSKMAAAVALRALIPA